MNWLMTMHGNVPHWCYRSFEKFQDSKPALSWNNLFVTDNIKHTDASTHAQTHTFVPMGKYHSKIYKKKILFIFSNKSIKYINKYIQFDNFILPFINAFIIMHTIFIICCPQRDDSHFYCSSHLIKLGDMFTISDRIAFQQNYENGSR